MCSPSQSQLLVASLVLLFLQGCGQDPVAPTSNRSVIEVSNPLLTFTESLQTEEIAYVVKDANGVPVPRPELTWSSSDERVAIVSSRGLVRALANGEAAVTIRYGLAKAVVSVEVEAASIPLVDGVPITGLSAPWRAWRYFSYEVPAGHAHRVLEVRLDGGLGVTELETGMCTSLSRPPVPNLCVLGSPPAGILTVGLHAVRDYEGVSLAARIVPMIGLTDGIPVSGISGAEGDLAYFTLDLPAGSSMHLTATGASGDVDLFSWFDSRFPLDALYSYDPFNSWPWDVPPDGWCKSVDGTTSESCSTAPASENTTVTIVLRGVEAFSDFNVTAEITS